jgi:hypothetical protein
MVFGWTQGQGTLSASQAIVEEEQLNKKAMRRCERESERHLLHYRVYLALFFVRSEKSRAFFTLLTFIAESP